MLSAHSRDLRRTKEKEHLPQSTVVQSDEQCGERGKES